MNVTILLDFTSVLPLHTVVAVPVTLTDFYRANAKTQCTCIKYLNWVRSEFANIILLKLVLTLNQVSCSSKHPPELTSARTCSDSDKIQFSIREKTIILFCPWKVKHFCKHCMLKYTHTHTPSRFCIPTKHHGQLPTYTPHQSLSIRIRLFYWSPRAICSTSHLL